MSTAHQPSPSPPSSPSASTSTLLYIRSLWYFAIRPFLIAIYESLAIWRVWRFVWYSPEVFKHAKHCLYLNGFAFLGSVVVYNWVLEPLMHFILTTNYSHGCQNWYFTNPDLATCTTHPFSTFEAIIGLLYNILWTIPVYLTSLVANGLWYQKIVTEVGRLQANPQELMPLPPPPRPQSDSHGQTQYQSDNNETHPHQQQQQQQQPAFQFRLLQRLTNAQQLSQSQSQPTTPTASNQSTETAYSPMRALSLIGENLSRIVIFILLLIQATILSLFSLPSLFSNNLVQQSTPIWLINTIWTNLPLISSYALTAISYTYVMFEYTWSNPTQQQEQLFAYHRIPSHQQQLVKQLQVLVDEHDLTQLHCRFLYTERRMFYFIGFSFFLTVTTFPLPILLSLALFNLLFPLFLLTSLFAGGHMTMLESPITSLDSSTSDPDERSRNLQSNHHLHTVDRIYHHNKLITPPRFPIFGPSRWANDVIFVYMYQKVKSFWAKWGQE